MDPTMFKVLGALIYCIIDKQICLDYIILQKYTNISSFNECSENESYNNIYGIGSTMLLMNIGSCNVFEKDNTPTVILTR